MRSRNGFTLIELLVYITTIAIASALMTAILMVVLRVQTREFASLGVSQEMSFLLGRIQKMVRDASYVNMPLGVLKNELALCMKSDANCITDTLQSTRIYKEGDALYIKEGSGASSQLTSAKVKVGEFSVAKYENPGGHSIVQVNLALSTNTVNPQAVFTRRLQTAIARVNAVTFDSDLVPSAATFNIGSPSGNSWKDGYFSGDVAVTNKLTVGPPSSPAFAVDPALSSISFSQKVGIGIANPVSALQIDGGSQPGYFQLDTIPGRSDLKDPDCRNSSHSGRMIYSTNNDLYICNGSAWKKIDVRNL